MKSFLIAVLSLFVTVHLTAQEGLFLTLGGNSSTLVSDGDFSSKRGYQLGIEYTDLYPNQMDVSTGLRFSNRGAADAGSTLNFSYLDASASVGYRPVADVRLYGGTHFSALLSSPQGVATRVFDGGLLFGARYDFGKVFLSAQYQYGLTNVLSGIDIGKTRGIELGLGFLLELKPSATLPTDTIVVSTEPMSTVVMEDAITADSATVQARPKEIGVSFRGLDRFDLIYRERVHSRRYTRVGVFSSGINSFPDANLFAVTLGIRFGPEYRRMLDEATYVAHGPQFELFGTYIDNDGRESAPLSVGFGYLIGLYHTVTDRVSLGIELQPSVTYRITDVIADDIDTELTANFSTSNIALVLGYKFGYKKAYPIR